MAKLFIGQCATSTYLWCVYAHHESYEDSFDDTSECSSDNSICSFYTVFQDSLFVYLHTWNMTIRLHACLCYSVIIQLSTEQHVLTI